jgi:branched-chain amino acid aminotransferase
MTVRQKPKFAYFQGAVRPYEGAVIHASSEAVFHGLNISEELKGFWQPDGSMGIVAVKRHFERLRRCARLLHFPFQLTLAQFEGACHALLEALCVPDRDMRLRATLYVSEGQWGEDQVADLIITGFTRSEASSTPMKVGVSTWRQPADVVAPVRTSTHYQVARLAKFEARACGYGDMILLNQRDRVAESTVACLLMVRDGTVYTTPASEGARDSITVDIVEALAAEQGIPFIRRPIERGELYIADELALIGTVTDIAPVTAVDGFATTRNSDQLARLSRRYQAAVRGLVPHAAVDLSRRLYRPTRISNEINVMVERGRKSVRLNSEAETRSGAAANPTGAAAC